MHVPIHNREHRKAHRCSKMRVDMYVKRTSRYIVLMKEHNVLELQEIMLDD